MMEFTAIENSGRNHRDSQKNSNHEFVNCDDSSALCAKKQSSRASLLEKWQKSPNQETGLGNRGSLKVLNDAKLILKSVH